jgi:diacylglycerol kinase family enzyme
MEAKQSGYHEFAMGVLCVGRGNDFAHSVGIPGELDEACHTLVQNQRRLVDIGRFTGGRHPEGRYFGNCVGIGFDTIATIEANKLPRMGGFLNYLIAVVKTIFLYYKGPLVHLKYNDQTLTQPSLLISIMNGRRLGGGFLMAPQAEPDDGFLDLCIADQVSRLRIFTLIPHFIRGTQATQPEINTARTAHITITAVEGTLPAQIDGEIISTDDKQLDIELLPRQIEIVYSPPEKVQ